MRIIATTDAEGRFFLFVNYETAKFSIIASSHSYLNMFYSIAKVKTHYIPWVKLVPVASLVGLDSVITSMGQFYFILFQRNQFNPSRLLKT